ncbi:glycosyltransferase [Candidatus Shapirobacteria bacterium]|nr:glycosyltransferase [Candidatus Shapirobacteria bacterium]
MKVAFVYDWLDSWGGAERLLLALKQIFPKAPLYTSIYNPEKASWAKDFHVCPSFLQKMPGALKFRKAYLPLLPLAFESFNFDQYDLVISVSSFAAKGIITKPATCHINYLLTPTRFLYHQYPLYFSSPLKRAFSKPLVSYLKRWDKIAAFRPDQIIAISQTVAKRTEKYYQRKVEKVIYPPVNTKKFFPAKEKKGQKEKYFLLVSRLEPYKKVDLAIEAFNSLGWKLKIVGNGSEEKKLKKISRKNIEFLGKVSDQKLVSFYQNCRAVIFPQEEDFGLVPLEAQACGRPVIAYRGGGATETIIDGKTGLFFFPQKAGALKNTLLKFDPLRYNKSTCRENALKYGQEKFEREWKEVIKKKKVPFGWLDGVEKSKVKSQNAK